MDSSSSGGDKVRHAWSHPEEALEGARDWFCIPTPAFQRLLDEQDYDERRSRISYTMMGMALALPFGDYRRSSDDDGAGSADEPYVVSVVGSGCSGKTTLFNFVRSLVDDAGRYVDSTYFGNLGWKVEARKRTIPLFFEANTVDAVRCAKCRNTILHFPLDVPLNRKRRTLFGELLAEAPRFVAKCELARRAGIPHGPPACRSLLDITANACLSFPAPVPHDLLPEELKGLLRAAKVCSVCNHSFVGPAFAERVDRASIGSTFSICSRRCMDISWRGDKAGAIHFVSPFPPLYYGQWARDLFWLL